MTVFREIPSALIAGYRQSGAFSDELTSYPNVQFTPPATSQAWAQLWHIPAADAALTVNNADEYMGVFQIDINAPRNQGEGLALQKAGQLLSVFKRGARMETDTGHVVITGCYASAGFEDNGWWKVPVTVRYRGFYTR